MWRVLLRQIPAASSRTYGAASLRRLANLSGESLNAFAPGHLMVRKAKQQRDAARSFRVIAIEFRRGFRIAFASLIEQARKSRLRQGRCYRGGSLSSRERQRPCLL